jgi:uncharacterized protein with von Willebrand factor type A (vWA) domain
VREEVSDAEIRAAIARYAPVRPRGLVANTLAFARLLRELGFAVSLGQALDASRALEWIEIGAREDFRAALGAHFVSRGEERELFDRAFDLYWSAVETEAFEAAESAPEEGEVADGGAAEGEAEDWEAAADGPAEGASARLATYSPAERLGRRDFSELDMEESRAVARALVRIAMKIATEVSRRRKRARRGREIDARASLRRALHYAGEPMEMVRRRRRIRKTRIVLLCDVSGSMDCYSRFLIQFMYGLQNELWGVETFVFSTGLTRVTPWLRTRDIEAALARISEKVVGWSGGTNIGRSLETFNRDFAPALVSHRTVVIVISDGWDRGDVVILEREMSALKRRCRKILWLNPLLASENYEPLCKGMRAALPYLDYFLSAHNLNSLLALGKTLQSLAA